MVEPTQTASNDSASQLTADRPIESHHQDRLERTSFARHLATAITKWNESDSLVIALYGEWGIGKSSIKNLVLEQLRTGDNEAPDIVEFNPWYWTGHEDLSAAFFREILTTLRGDKKSADAKVVIRTIQRYAAYLGLLNVFLGGPKGLLVLVLTVFGLLSVVPPFFLRGENAVEFAKVLGAAALAIAAFVFWGKQVLENLAIWLGFVFPGPASLQDRKKAVVSALEQYQRTFLVVIDDVDRLTAQEIQAIFQLIKANADFPRFVYLVMFQRGTVEGALSDLSKEGGSAYLEKIVQVGFDVPQARQDEIDVVLFEGVQRLRDSEQLNQTHWGNVYFGAIRRYFENLREVKRFLGSFGFHLGLMRTNGALDVNPVDLIAIETLRVFEPGFYRTVMASKALLTGSRSPDATDKARVAQDIKALFEDLAHRGEALRALIRELFPTTAFAFGGLFSGGEIRSEWNRDLRICVPEFFDRYFQLGLSKGDISQYEVDMLLGLSSDGKGFKRELERLLGEGRLVAALDRLDYYKERIRSEHAVDALTVLFDVGGQLPEAPPGAHLGPEWTIQRICHQVLKRESEEAREEKIKKILQAPSGLRMGVMLVAVNSDPSERRTNPENVLIRETSLPPLQAICVDKIKKAAAEGQLLNQHELAYILFRWRDWATADEPRHWAQNVSGSPEGALALLRHFLYKGASQTVGDHVARIRYYMKYSDLESFVNLDAIEKQIAQLSESRLSELDRKTIEAFRKAAARKRSGKPDGIFGWDPD